MTSELRRWMLVVAVGQLALGAVVAVVSARAAAASETRAIAKDVLREEWVARLEAETRRIAAEAAASAARQAVVDVVTPLAIASEAHRAMDDQRQHETERRVDRLEDARRARP